MNSLTNRYITLRGLFFSFLIARKALLLTLLLFTSTLIVMILCTGIGSIFVAPLDVIRSIFGYGAETHELIIRSLRLPRVVTAVLIGASLAVSGAILQGVIRNPLTSPDNIGITGGAVLGAVSFFFFFADKLSIHWLPLWAITGAVAATLLIYMLAWKKGASPLRLVMIGIAVTAALNALSYMMMITGPAVLANHSLTFMTGSIYGVSWEKAVQPLLPWVAALLPLLLVYARHINVQELGEDVARSVGSTVQRQRFLLLLLSVALGGAAIAFGGAISFIGLMAPHMARRLVGPSFGALLPVSALIGAILLLLADLAGRMLVPPLDIPAGVFTASVGAPLFVFLLYRSQRR
ncbi:iron ABC transporter permease [Paenibacillus sp. YYML68]|uniref:FecCD family ABC transporter permease n=1 Tax=Paenibacillus sp. YYML68 TaxID=2909250 RepID=UPI00248FDB5C|nr:iron ABC transporter permease [Paenibacillus sp. YYML68]